MSHYLLDTNHLSEGIDKVSPLRDRIQIAHLAGHRFATCWPALFELEMGVVQTKDPAACRRYVRILLKKVRIRPMDWDLMAAVGQFHLLAKKRGRALAFTDKVLGALALKENAVLLTTDLDFEAFPEIRTENWLAAP